MIALARGELIKAVTTRTLLAYLAATVALAISSVLILTLSGDLTTIADKQGAISGGPVLLLLLGIVGGAGEYRHRTAAPAMLVAPGRGRLLVGRAGAYALMGLAVGVLTLGVTLALGLPLLGGEPGPGLTGGDIATVAAGSLIAAVLSAIMGVAIGTLLRNQVAGVVGALIVAFIVDPLLPRINEAVADFTPMGAANALAGFSFSDTLSWGWAGLVVLAWTVPLMIAAVIVDRRRDVA